MYYYQLKALEVHPQLSLEEKDEFPPQQQILPVALMIAGSKLLLT